jgi:hypothetical protein
MKVKSIGLTLFVIGILYMAIDRWFIFWSLSVPLGSIITALGLAVYIRLEKLRFLIFIACSLILLGIPSFGLRPEKLIEFNTQGILFTMSVKVPVCFTLGWIFLAWSQYSEYKILKTTSSINQNEP